MGLVRMGIPEQLVIALASINNCTAFVETGTFQGATTRWAANHFAIVHTIERSESLYIVQRETLARLPGVTPHLGDSRTILPGVVSGLGQQRAVYWLDGHWSGGETAGEGDECPVIDELACLAERNEDIILIDDARLFLCAPPHPHNPSQWPTIADVVSRIARPGERFVQIVDDVIFIIPDKPALKQHLVEYCRGRANSFWREFAGNHPVQTRESPVERLVAKVRRVWAA